MTSLLETGLGEEEAARAEEYVLDTNIVMGLDTASDRFHFVTTLPLIMWSNTMDDPKIFGEVLAGPKGEKDLQRVSLHQTARRLFGVFQAQGQQSHRACHVFCEEPLALKNGKTTRLLALAGGAIWAAHVDFNIWWHWVDVASWKKEVVGRGNASKEDVKDFCLDNPAFKNEMHGVVDSDGDLRTKDDIFDAWCLKVYGVRWLVRSETSGGA